MNNSRNHSQSKKKEPPTPTPFEIEPIMKKADLKNEELTPFDQNINYILLSQKIKEILNTKDDAESTKNDWTTKLAGINYLRRLFKFEKTVFDQTFYGLKLYEKVPGLINSTRSVLAKNILLLLDEILNCCTNETSNEKIQKSLESLIKLVIPVLVSKINSNQSFIKNESNSCLDAILNKMNSYEILLNLIQLLKKKKGSEFNLIIDLIKKSIKLIGKENLLLIKDSEFNEMIKIISGLSLENKDVIHLTKYKNILDDLIEIISKEEFEKKLMKSNKKDQEIIKGLLEKEKDKKPNTKKNDRISSSSNLHKLIEKSRIEKKNNCSTKQPNHVIVKTSKIIERSIKIIEGNKENNNTNNSVIKISVTNHQ